MRVTHWFCNICIQEFFLNTFRCSFKTTCICDSWNLRNHDSWVFSEWPLSIGKLAMTLRLKLDLIISEETKPWASLNHLLDNHMDTTTTLGFSVWQSIYSTVNGKNRGESGIDSIYLWLNEHWSTGVSYFITYLVIYK